MDQCLAGNVVLNYFPAFPLVQASQPATVGISISGLGNFQPPHLGSFDLILTYDPLVLAYQSTSFTAMLGGIASISSATNNQPGPGQVELVEVSTVLGPLNFQPSSFLLANVTFVGQPSIPSQTSHIVLTSVLLGDENGNPLTLSGINSVPEPSTLLLAFAGLLGFAIYRARVLQAFRRTVVRGGDTQTPQRLKL